MRSHVPPILGLLARRHGLTCLSTGLRPFRSALQPGRKQALKGEKYLD